MTNNVEIIEWYLSETGMSVSDYRNRIYVDDMRIGQAFFNSLSVADQGKVSRTPFDPFYKDSFADVARTVEFLIDNN